MEEMTLKEWTIHFVKNKDIVTKTLVDYEDKGSSVVFHFKDKDKTFLVVKNLGEEVLSFANGPGIKSVVCEAAPANLKFLIENWTTLKTVENLSFVFVRIKANAKWIISPYVHNRICDDESLVLGLKSMYSNAFQS